MSMRKVVIGGGTGYIGSRIAQLLSKEGYQTVCVSQDSKKAPLTWSNIESYGLPSDTHAVINVAGINVFLRFWTSEFKQEIRESRIETTRILAKAITNTAAKSFITISGVGYYKPDKNIYYDEESQCEPFDFFSQLCHDWEAAAKLPSSSEIRQATIRSGVVLGNGSGIDQNMRTFFKYYMGGPISDGSQYMPWIHINDLVNMFSFTLKNENVSGVLNGVAPKLATNGEFTREYARALGVFAIAPTPAFMMKLVFHKERAVLLLEGQKIMPRRPLELGFKYQYSTISDACQAMV